MKEIDKIEVIESIKRFLKRTEILDSKDYCLFVDTANGKVYDKNNKCFKLNNLLRQDKISIKGPLFLIGYEKSVENNFKYIENAQEWKLFDELFHERIGYVSVPFDPELLFVRKKDPIDINLISIKKVIEGINKLLEKDSCVEFQDIFFSGSGRFEYKDVGEEARFGHESQPKARLRAQLINMIEGLVRFEKGKKEKLRVLLIDNNPGRELNKIDSRFEGLFKEKVTLKDVLDCFKVYFTVYYYMRDFSDLYKNISKIKENESLIIDVEEKNHEKNTLKKVKVDKFDFILVDMFLGEDQPNGTAFIHILAQKYPHIPAFILSVSDDFRVIRRAIKEGADFYLIKNQILSLPYIYWNYLEEIGRILNFVKNPSLRKNLIGNIRYWMFKKDLLWFGDKCYHMINHSYIHALNDWKYLNNLFYPLLEENKNLLLFKISKSKTKNRSGIKHKDVVDDWIYSLCMSIWLHDIGHKGTERYGESYKIRDNHGYITAEYVLKYPTLFRILEEEENENYYKNINFKSGREGSAIEILYKRKINKFSNAEKIALISAYHKSNMPITEKEYRLLKKSEKHIPTDFYEDGKREDEKIITLEKILNKVYGAKAKNTIMGLFYMFRLIDGLDNNISRVGDESEKKLKTIVVENDRDYELSEIKNYVEILANVYFPPKTTGRKLFIEKFYLDIKNDVINGKIIKYDRQKEIYPQKRKDEFENYILHTNYASFISVQKTHFDFHSSIEEIDIEYLGKKRFRFIIISPRKEKEMRTLKVKESGLPEISVFDRIIGKNDSRLLSELNSGKDYLQKYWINGVEIVLIDSERKESRIYWN